MGKESKKSKSSKKERKRSPSASTSSSSSSSRSRSRSRDRSSRKRSRHESSSSRRSKHRSRSRSRSPARDKKKSKRRDASSSRSRSRSRTPERRAKRERHSSPPVKREPSASAYAAASAAAAAPAPAPSSAFDARRLKEEEKARLKASETPAERLARRQAKKALKHKGGAGGAGDDAAADAAGGGGGAGGGKPFIWKKKYEKSIEEGLDPHILSREELAKKQATLAAEILAIKARKVARAEEKAQMEQLREQMSRDAEAENIEGWEEKEDAFHRSNALLRTQLRIQEGREKCIDVLAKNRALFKKLLAGPSSDEVTEHPEWEGAALDPNLEAQKDIELTEPHLMFVSGDLPWRDLEFLKQDIEAYIQLGDKQDEQYWDACITLCTAAIIKQKTAAFAPGAAQSYNRSHHQHHHHGSAAASAGASSSSSSSSNSVKDDIALLLRGKSLGELELLERDIGLVVSGSAHASAALRALSEGLDQNYWESVLKELTQFKCVAYLREFHQELLKLRLQDLQRYVLGEEAREKQRRAPISLDRVEAAGGGAEGAQKVQDMDAAAEAAEAAGRAGGGGAGAGLDGLPEDINNEAELAEFEPTLIPHDQFAAGDADTEGRQQDGSFSPTLVPDDEDEQGRPLASASSSAAAAAAASSSTRGLRAIDPEADARELAEARRLVAAQKQREVEERAKMAAGSSVSVSAATAVLFGPPILTPAAAGPAAAAAASSSSSDAAFRRESGRGLEGDEIQLRSEFSIPEQTYWWGDKFRPRKPRFFNRVKTGFEWNKYNGTHYDKENPPPKIVQGYKFNIFYPDLIDPSVAPRYRIEPDPAGNPDFCIIRFMAGPPYEDLAFKIVKKEWEYSFKRGYKYDPTHPHNPPTLAAKQRRVRCVGNGLDCPLTLLFYVGLVARCV